MCICAKKAKKIKAQLETDKRQRGKYQAFPEKQEEKRRKELEREKERESDYVKNIAERLFVGP